MMTAGQAVTQGAPGGRSVPAADIDAKNKQYYAASRGIPFTAIRPIAIKAAEQHMRIGTQNVTEATKRSARLRHKAYEPGINGLFLHEKDRRHAKILSSAPETIKIRKDDVQVIDEDRFLDAIDDPNPYLTRWAMMYCTIFSLEAVGEAVWILDKNGEDFDIWYMPRHWVTPVHDKENGMAFTGWQLNPPGSVQDTNSKPIPADLVCHFFYPHPGNPLASHSAIQAQSHAVNTDEEMQRSQLNMTKNIQRPSMLITMGEIDGANGKEQMELTPDQREDVIQSVRRMYAGAMQFGDPFILDAVVADVKPYMPALTDLDYKEGSKLTKSRIMEGVGTNPIAAGQVEGANRASAYVAHDTLFNLKVNPALELVGQTLSKKISKMRESRTLVWFDKARAKDPDLMNRRFAGAAKYAELLTKGEVRNYLATGEFEAEERDDDDELASTQPKAAEAEGGEAGAAGGDNIVGDSSAGFLPGDNETNTKPDDANQKLLDPYKLIDLLDYAESRAAARVRRYKALSDASVIDVANPKKESTAGEQAASNGDLPVDSHSAQGSVEASEGDAMTKSKGGSGGGGCGTGSGGFKPGNTCAKGGGSGGGAIADGWMPQTSYPGAAGWKKENSSAKAANNSIAMMEAMADKGQWDLLAAMKDKINLVGTKSEKNPNSYQKGKMAAYASIMAAKPSVQAMKMTAAQAGLTGKKVDPPLKTSASGLPDFAGVLDDDAPVKLSSKVTAIDKWTKTSGKLGTQEGGKFKSPGGTQEIYAKFPDDPENARKEHAAFQLYKLAGGNVPDSALVELNGKLGIATKWDNAAEKIAWDSQASVGKKISAQGDFALHAWMNNRDAVGAGSENPMDNIKWSVGQGQPSKAKLIDAGGSFDVKGLGTSKPFTNSAAEWDSMRSSKNPTMHKVFGNMTADQLQKSASKLNNISDKQIDEVMAGVKDGGKLAATLKARKKSILKKAASLTPAASAKPASEQPLKKAAAAQAAKVEKTTSETGNSFNVTTVAPALTPPKFTTSKTNSGHNVTMQKMYDAAKDAAVTGDTSKLDAIKTKAGATQGYAKKKHAYKMTLLNELSAGAKPSDAHVTTPPAASGSVTKPKTSGKVMVGQLPKPTDSAFSSKSSTYGEANKKANALLYAEAKNGDIEKVKAMVVKGPKSLAYQKALVSNMHDQLNPPPPPKTFGGQLGEIASKFAPTPHTKAHFQGKKVQGDRIGRLIVLGNPGVYSDFKGMPKADNDKAVHSVGLTAWNKLEPGMKAAVKKYTGGAYGGINRSLSKGKPKKGSSPDLAARGVMKAASDIGGSTIYRGFTFQENDETSGGQTVADMKKKMKASVGQIVQDPGIGSYGRVQSKGWGGQVKMEVRAAPGFKALGVGKFSNHKSEDELVTPPGARLHIQSVEQIGDVLHVKAIGLPSVDEQYPTK